MAKIEEDVERRGEKKKVKCEGVTIFF